MDSELQSQIQNATIKARDKKEKLDSSSLDGFIKNCEHVAENYMELAKTYEDESKEWMQMVKELLDCVENSLPEGGNFDELLKEIDGIKTEFLNEESENKLKVANENIEKIKKLIEDNKLEKTNLANKKTEACDKKKEGTESYDKSYTAPVTDPYSLDGGGRKRKSKPRPTRKLKLKSRR